MYNFKKLLWMPLSLHTIYMLSSAVNVFKLHVKGIEWYLPCICPKNSFHLAKSETLSPLSTKAPFSLPQPLKTTVSFFVSSTLRKWTYSICEP